MPKKAIVIIPNEQIHQIPLFVSNCENSHLEGFSKFIYHSDMNYSITKNTSSQEIAFFLGELGYTVMLYDYDEAINENNLVIFLPSQISPKQIEWFEKRKKGLSNYNIMIFENVIDKNWIPIDKTTTEEPMLSELERITNKRLIKKPN